MNLLLSYVQYIKYEYSWNMYGDSEALTILLSMLLWYANFVTFCGSSTFMKEVVTVPWQNGLVMSSFFLQKGILHMTDCTSTAKSSASTSHQAWTDRNIFEDHEPDWRQFLVSAAVLSMDQ